MTCLKCVLGFGVLQDGLQGHSTRVVVMSSVLRCFGLSRHDAPLMMSEEKSWKWL